MLPAKKPVLHFLQNYKINETYRPSRLFKYIVELQN